MAEQSVFNWKISGHSRQLDLLSRAVAGNRLAHAYIFAGPEQVGKKTVARQLTQHLLCDFATACGQCAQCKTLAAGSNPDYIEVPSDSSIKIETVRDLSYKLSLMPYSGRQKIAVIDNAHLMTNEAANSLLKILEEPKDRTLIILVTSSPHLLLPTIVSRSQKINFGPQTEQEYISDSEKQHNATRQEWFEKFQSESLGNRLVLAAQLAEQDGSDLVKTIYHWLGQLQISLRQNPTQATANRIREVSKAYRLLQQNANPKLTLVNLMAST